MVSLFSFNHPVNKILFIYLPLIFTLFILSGCVSLSKGECSKGDWSKIGSRDAIKGLLSNEQLKRHHSACSSYKITPNKQQYQVGYKKGLIQFCRRESGLKFGSNGSQYLATCLPSPERNFLSGYILGLEFAMDAIADDIDELLHERYHVHRKLDALYHSNHSASHQALRIPKPVKPSSHSHHKQHRKRIERLESRLRSLKLTIQYKRSEMNKLRSWHLKWRQVLKK